MTRWSRYLTPLRLKGLIARSDHLLTQRKHNAVHAMGCGVPFTGIHPAADDNLARIL
ncbi:polysaccharide pyruvyl transferase family protein [Acetobacteraceae bacterium KSS8]|uniref:Polysaccharide pyruvyl transferase family protein n=1 Tax=Endosaccharibacter trunci TaxID=2812733 RepID=A0ABT1W6C4_9PROT|nr:polysaccharide pyruvyl transferase family protein [Acetobacteraceae bacterium KSS8]